MDPAAKRPGQQPIWMRFVDPSESWLRAIGLGTAATALTLGGSFLNFLNYNGYPVESGEAALVLAGILAASLVAGVCAAALGVFGRVFVPTFLVVLAIDMNFDAGLPIVLGAIVALLFARFARQALILVFAVVTISQVWIALMGPASGRSAIAGKPVSMTSATPAKPDIALIHLILDEHIGLEGIPDSLRRGSEMREYLRDFYVGYGFRIFAGAYSESLHTVNAIPHALSLTTVDEWKRGARNGTALEANPYFDKLQSMGFRIDVAQSDWIDYCHHPAVDTCVTRAAGSPIDVGERLPTPDRAAILVYRFAALSRFAKIGFGLYDMAAWHARDFGLDLPLVQLLRQTNTSALNGMATFEDVIAVARTLTPGKAIFAHVLLPHFPYVYDASCGMRRVGDWLGRASSVPLETRYAAYFDQVTCATRKVGELLAAVAASPAAGKTVLVIHGDHGSRIMEVEPTVENDGKFTDRDLVRGYAAFFAVSGPGIEPGYDTGRYPLRLLLGALAGAQFRAIAPHMPSGFVPTIAIEDRDWDPVTIRPVGDLDWWKNESAEPAEAGIGKLVP